MTICFKRMTKRRSRNNRHKKSKRPLLRLRKNITSQRARTNIIEEPPLKIKEEADKEEVVNVREIKIEAARLKDPSNLREVDTKTDTKIKVAEVGIQTEKTEVAEEDIKIAEVREDTKTVQVEEAREENKEATEEAIIIEEVTAVVVINKLAVKVVDIATTTKDRKTTGTIITLRTTP